MRERNYHGTSTHSMSGRLLAFLLVFSMMLGVCPAALADGEAKVVPENPTLEFTGTAISDGEAATGTGFGLKVSVGFNSDTTNGVENPEVRLYIGNMNDETLTSFPNGGKVAGLSYTADGVKYTVAYDETAEQNYLKIEKYNTETKEVQPWIGGDTIATILGVQFDTDAANGTEWKAELKVINPATGAQMNDSTIVAVTAKSSVTMNNTKSTSSYNILIGTDATTMGQDIVYSLAAFTGSAPDTDTKLAAGEAAVTEYTVTDTLELPAGLYINEDDISKAISSSIAGYVVTPVTNTEGKVTKLNITYTVINSSTASQINDLSGTLTLNGAYVQVDSSFNYTSTNKASITNTISTAYKTINDPSTAIDVEPVTVTTTAYKPTAGSYTNQKKEIKAAVSNYNTWNWGSGYLVEGDYVLYKVSYQNSSSDSELTGGTVTDTLPSGLKLVSGLNETEAASLASTLTNLTYWSPQITADQVNAGAWVNSGTADSVTINGNEISFTNITLAAGATFEGYILAKLTADASQTITNTASIGGDEVSTSFVQQKKTPNLKIDKSAVNNTNGGNTGYEPGDSVTYTITLKNDGTADISGVALTDVFPSGSFDVASITVEGANSSEYTTNADSEAGTAETIRTYSLGTYTVGAKSSVTVTITGTVKSDAADEQIKNTATAAYTDPETDESVSISDDAVLSRISPATYVTITKTGDKDGQYVKKGSTVTYTITVDMDGKTFTETEPLVISDNLPAGLTYVSSDYDYTNAGAGTAVTEIDNGNKNAVLYQITGSGVVVITAAATVDTDTANGTALTNTAAISGGSSASSGTTYVGDPDAITAVKSAVVYRDDTQAATIKAGETAAIQAGDRIDFDIVITNNSDDDVTSFTLYDTLVGKYLSENTGWTTTDGAYSRTPGDYPIEMSIKGSTGSIAGIDENKIWNNWKSITVLTNSNNGTYTTETTESGTTIINSTGESTFVFANTTDINHDTNIWEWQNPNFNMPPGSSITLTYSVTAAETFTMGSNSVRIEGSNQTSTVSYTLPTPEPTPTPDPDATPAPSDAPTPTPEPVTSNAKLSIEKTVSRSFGGAAVSEIVFENSSDLNTTTGEVMYTVTVRNDSDEAYETKQATLLDKLPEQFGLKIQQSGNVWIQEQSYIGNTVKISNYKLASVPEEGDYATADWILNADAYAKYNTGGYNAYPENWFSASLYTEDDGETFILNPGEYFTLVYCLKLKTSAANALRTESGITQNEDGSWPNSELNFSERLATNTAYFTADNYFKNKDGKTVKVIADTETVNLRSETAHPGIVKKAYAYLEEAGSAIIEGSAGAKPGARLIWHMVISNDKDTNGTGADMTKYTLTDQLPAGYKYIDEQTYTNTAVSPVTYPNDLTDTDLQKGQFVIHRASGKTEYIDFVAPAIDETTNELTWEFDASQNSEFRLAAGDWIEFVFITEPDSTEYASGVYYNKAILQVNDKYYESTVSVGTVEDGNITDGDSFSINTILTSGSISVNVGGNTAVGGTENNTVTVPEGTTTATYTLTVENSDTSGSIKNVSIINRLPYVGDSGVLVSGQRGSEYDAVYAGNMVVTIHKTDGSTVTLGSDQFTFTTYSGDISKVFTETSVDWTDLGAVGWSDTADSSTKLIRIQIGNDDNPIELTPGEYITVSYDVNLPTAGGDTEMTGWNGFAYHYDSATTLAKDMAAEPASVGVTIPANTTQTGSIRVRKVFASDKVTTETFYFICVGADGNQYGDVQQVTIKSSGRLSAPIYAEVTFTDLPCTEIGKSVYYYIYETDENGNKLSQKNVPYEMYTGYYRPDLYTYNFANPEAPVVTNGEEVITNNITYAENQAYLMKGLSPSLTSNSAIFSNILWAIPTYTILQSFYADVPANAEAAESDTLTSTRTNADGTASTQSSSVRGTDDNTYANADAGTVYEGAYDGFGGTNHGHTIATGFLAEVKSASDAITSITWNITTSATDDNPVYVRAPKSVEENGMFGSIQLDGVAYDDGSEDTGYKIYNVAKGNSYTLKIKDDTIPVISGNGTAYIGIIIDQLYDQNAIAALNFNGEADKTISGNSGDVTAAGTAVKQTQSIRGITSIDYEIKLNDSAYYESADEGAALKASTVEELAKHGITLDAGTRYHDSNHGAYKLQTIDIDAPGAVTITLGDCLYGAASVQLLDENGNEIDKATLKTGCYHNGAVVELKYTGTAPAKLKVKFSSTAYLPYLKVKSIGTEPTEPDNSELIGTTYDIALNDINNYDTSGFEAPYEGAPLLASTITALSEHGIILDAGTQFHDSTHGTKNLYTIDIDAPGPVDITLGDCQFSNSQQGVTAMLQYSDGTQIATVDMGTSCSNNVVLSYTGTGAAKLQVKFFKKTDGTTPVWVYLPYLKVEYLDVNETTTVE
ncbi:MAG: beta strand repeat-containing protein [Candidatus Ornithomonoglobus sp.]